MSLALPDRIIAARPGNYRGRRRHAPIWIVVHCTDRPYHDHYPTRLGDYWATELTEVSAHFGVSDTELVQYVDVEDVAYAAGNPGNDLGIHLEFSGLPSWDTLQWLTHRPMLARAAALVDELAAQFGIPRHFQDESGVAMLRPGITGHRYLVAAFGGTHTCPGGGFPYDTLLRTGEDDMFTDDDRNALKKIGWALGTNPGQVPEQVRDANQTNQLDRIEDTLMAIVESVTGLATAVQALSPLND